MSKAIQRSATTQFLKQKHRTSADVFEMPNKESERKRKKPRAADRCDIFFRSFQWHQSLNGRTRQESEKIQARRRTQYVCVAFRAGRHNNSYMCVSVYYGLLVAWAHTYTYT